MSLGYLGLTHHLEAVQESGIPSTIFPQINPVRETGLPKSPQMGMGRLIAWWTPRQLWDDQSHLTKYGFPWFSLESIQGSTWGSVKYAKIILMPVFPHFPLGESTSGGDPLGSSRWLCRGPKRHLGSALSTRLRQEPAVQDGAEALSSCWLQRKVPRLPLDFTVEKGWCEGFAKCQELVGSVVLWAGLCLLTNLICALLVVGIWKALHPITQRLGPSNKFDCQKCGQTLCLRHRYEEEHDCRRGWPKAHALGFGSMSVSRPSQNTLGIWNLLICLRLRGQSICLSPTCSVSALWFHHWRISNHPPSRYNTHNDYQSFYDSRETLLNTYNEHMDTIGCGSNMFKQELFWQFHL
jgi:hypothetical protein